MQVEDDGKSECLVVMTGIRDETIALTRKRADFHLVIYRKIGLLIAPGGDDVTFPQGIVASFLSGTGGCSSMAELKLPKLTTRVRFPSPAPPAVIRLDHVTG